MSSEFKQKLPSWRAMHADTDPRIEEIQFRFFREASAMRKFEMVGELNKGVQMLAESGLRSRFPDATPSEIKRRLADVLLGPELAERVYGSLDRIEKQEEK